MKLVHSLVLSVLVFSLSVGKVNAQFLNNGERNLVGLSVYGGVSVPTGALSTKPNPNMGTAMEGYAIGVDGDVRLLDFASWMTSVDLSVNKMKTDISMHAYGISQTASPWTNIWALTGVKASMQLSPETEVFCFGQGGLLYGSAPEVTFITVFTRFVQSSDPVATLGYGAGAGIVYRRLMLNARYLGGAPKYTTNFTDGVRPFITKLEQPTACIIISAGFAF